MSILSVVNKFVNLGVKAFATIESIRIAEKQFDLEKDIVEIQIELQGKFSDRETQIVNLQLESIDTTQDIDAEVRDTVIKIAEAQRDTVVLEEELKRELLKKQIQEVVPSGNYIEILKEKTQEINNVILAQEQKSLPEPQTPVNITLPLVVGGAFLLALGLRKKKKK